LAYWIVGGIAGLIGLVGLILAAEGNREGIALVYWGGLAIFAVIVLAEFWLIRLWFDHTTTSPKETLSKPAPPSSQDKAYDVVMDR